MLLLNPAKQNNYSVCIVAFYNLENLYDTTNNPQVNDDDFTPSGSKHYTHSIYQDKLTRLASVISLLGTDYSADGPALLGVAEIENDTVLTDLINQPQLQYRHYRFIHFDSKDLRGIDVALLYHPKYFLPEKAEKLWVDLPDKSKETAFTRDILYVMGNLAGERIHILVNHWPSRRGGEVRSSPAREAAAKVCKKKISAIFQLEPEAKIILMGDFNDDPDSYSIKGVLGARERILATKPGEIYNPWTDLYRKGLGTLANRDSWGLFDQILLSHAWLNKQQYGFFFHKQMIFNKEFMKETMGAYKGYPMRTWDGDVYRGGYSDHFPTFIILLKSIK